jgi:hypothetical protein
MAQTRRKDLANPLSGANFPMIFEQGQPKAFIIDIQKYRELELLVDNLINLREEDEDVILRDSDVLRKLVERAREESRSAKDHVNWEVELDAL